MQGARRLRSDGSHSGELVNSEMAVGESNIGGWGLSALERGRVSGRLNALARQSRG